MTAPDFVVPPALRSAMFVPRQAPGRREPARVTPGAFRAAGLPVPEQPARQNVYQLTERQGLPWTPSLDAHIARRGGELLGGGDLVQVDVDVPAAVDGSPMINSLRWLAERAVEAGDLLDLTATVSVRTPGHPESGHLPGWHLWFRAPDHPVRMGPLARCRAVELRGRGTCPGSPGYEVVSAPGELPALPGWLAGLAGAPRVPVQAAGAKMSGSVTGVWNRLHGILGRLLVAERGERNALLFWAATRAGEMVTAGTLELPAAERALVEAADDLGLVREDGTPAVVATIRSGFERAGVAYEPAR